MERNIYRPFRSLSVPGQTLENIQGEKVAPTTAPFFPGYIGHFSVVSHESGDSESTLVQVTKDHGRSFKLQFGETPSIFWQDEHWNIFSTLTTKGNRLENPQVAGDLQSPSGFLVYGMQDTDALVRTLRVSKLLREHHADTECYIRIIEPQALPYEGKLVPLEQFKNNLVKQVEELNSPQGRGKKIDFGTTVSLTDIPKLSEHLDNSTFVITVRGMQVAERLQDLDKPATKEEFIKMMGEIFRYVNYVEGINLDPEKKEDLLRYFQEYLPKRIASNYGILHKLGLLHAYAHQGNISAVGSIYDLDSVRGESTKCGDERVEKDELRNEFYKVCSETAATISRLAQKGFIETGEETIKTFEANFYSTYIGVRFGTETDFLSQVADITDLLYDDFADTKDVDKLNKFVETLIEKIGWDYHHSETIEELIEAFYKEDEINIKKHIENALKNPNYKGSIKDILETCLEDLSKDYPSDRFSSHWLEARIMKKIREEHQEDLAKIENEFGKAASDAVVELLALREDKRLNPQVTDDIAKDINRKSQNRVDTLKYHYLRPYYLQLFEKPTDGFDPLAEIKSVAFAFEYFDSDEDKQARNQFLGIISNKLGWNYQHGEEFLQITKAYFYNLNFYVRAFFIKAWNNNPDQKEFEKAFNQAVNSATNCHELESVYTFMHQRIKEAIETLYDDELFKLRKTYKIEALETLSLLISYREADRVTSGHEEEAEAMSKKVDQFLESIKADLAKIAFSKAH